MNQFQDTSPDLFGQGFCRVPTRNLDHEARGSPYWESKALSGPTSPRRDMHRHTRWSQDAEARPACRTQCTCPHGAGHGVTPTTDQERPA